MITSLCFSDRSCAVFFSREEKRAVTMRIVILIVALAILLQLTAVTQALKQEGKFQLRFASISKV